MEDSADNEVFKPIKIDSFGQKKSFDESQVFQAINADNKPAPKKKWILLIIYFFLFSIGISTAVVYRGVKLNKSVKKLTEEQKNNFQELTIKYNQILVLLETTSQSTEQENNSQLLNNFQENVLGLESDRYVLQTRKISAYFKESLSLISDIKETNQEIKTKLQTPYFNIFLPDDDGLIEKTAFFSASSKELMSYFKESTNLNLKLFNLSFEVGASIEDAIYRNADKTAIANLEAKINEIDSFRSQWQALDTSLLSPDIKNLQEEGTDSIIEFKDLLTNIKNSIEQKDAQKLLKELQTLLIQSGVESQTANIESIHLWENNQTINLAFDLKNDWERYGEKFKLPSLLK